MPDWVAAAVKACHLPPASMQAAGGRAAAAGADTGGGAAEARAPAGYFGSADGEGTSVHPCVAAQL